jgi:hypothetical protein
VFAVYAVAVVAGAGFVAGAWFRVSGPLFAAMLLLLCTYRSSWGQLLWFENLMVLHVAIVGLAHSADALCWPRHAASKTIGSSEVYGAPVRLAALITVATYVVAGVAKLRFAGADWVTTETLRNHVASSVVRADLLHAPASPIGRWLVGRGWVFPPLAAVSLVMELAAPLAFAGRRWRDVWVALTWVMHVSIAALMYVVFPYPLFLVAFAPLYDLEVLVSRAARLCRGRARAALPS